VQFGANTRTDKEKDFLLAHIPQLAGCGTCTADQDCVGGACITPPFTPGGAGETCTGPADCANSLCASGPGGMKCTLDCTPGVADECPDGFECLDQGTHGLCWPGSGGGCCDAGRGGPTALLGLAAITAAWSRRRRPV
jgi:hypothetical protein